MKKIKIKNLQETNKMQMLARKREGTCIAIVKTKLGLWLQEKKIDKMGSYC